MQETIKTYEFDNCIVRLHIPELTEEERARRMEKFKKSTAKFLYEVERQREGQKA